MSLCICVNGCFHNQAFLFSVGLIINLEDQVASHFYVSHIRYKIEQFVCIYILPEHTGKHVYIFSFAFCSSVYSIHRMCKWNGVNNVSQDSIPCYSLIY